MIRFWVLIALSISAVAGQSDDDVMVTPRIGGELERGCFDCYKCDDFRVKDRKKNKLTITDKYNKVTEVCCNPQTDLIVSDRDGGTCGKRKEIYYRDPVLINGKKQKRKSARSILFGDYPWRAFIYYQQRRHDRNMEKTICAGSVIDSRVRYILTSASCVHKYHSHSLRVSFTRRSYDSVAVRNILIHEHYNEHNPFVNDIALLFLDESKHTPSWAQPVCLASWLPLPVASCVVMSDEDYFIETIAVNPQKCASDKKELHVSQMCSVTNIDDYKAELGSGLVCQDKYRTGGNEYYAFGITLQVRDDLIIHTNVSHFHTWITENVDLTQWYK